MAAIDYEAFRRRLEDREVELLRHKLDLASSIPLLVAVRRVRVPLLADGDADLNVIPDTQVKIDLAGP